jgi:DNA-binding transcriptional MerR regulator
MSEPAADHVVESFQAAQAARLAGLTVDMVNYLCRSGIVVPSLGARGRGRRRLFSFADVLFLRIVAKLLENGISVLRLKKAFNGMRARGREYSTDMLSKRFLVIDGHDVFVQDGELLERLESGQMAFAFVLELGSLRRQLSGDVAKYAAVG